MPTLNENVARALSSVAAAIEKGQLRRRYADAVFAPSGLRKAQAAYARLPESLRTARPIIVSLGGADGSELLELAKLCNGSHALLLEYSDDALKTARSGAQEAGITLHEFGGDAMAKIDIAMEHASDLRESTGAPVLVTIFALIHELFTRSRPGFDLRDLFPKLRAADHIIGREPIDPEGWPDKVLLTLPGVDLQAFRRLSDVIQERVASLRACAAARVIDGSTIELDRRLAMETLVKAFYPEHILYELGESVTALHVPTFQSEMEMCFSDSRARAELVTSDSIHQYWQEFGIVARHLSGAPAPVPFSHIWYQVPLSKRVDTLTKSGHVVLTRRPSPTTMVNPKDGSVLVWIEPGESLQGTHPSDFTRNGWQANPDVPTEAVVERIELGGYWFARSPITNSQYREFIRETGHRAPERLTVSPFDRPNCPVIGVSWDDALDYLDWAGLRFPSEAEWERAARGHGPQPRSYPWGDEPPDTHRLCFASNATAPTPCGRFLSGATPEGIVDLAGNVLEWCADPPRIYGAMPPMAGTDENMRAIRGGSFKRSANECRAAYRDARPRNHAWGSTGIRPAGTA